MKRNIYLWAIIILFLSSSLGATDISNVRPIGGEIFQNSTTYTVIWDSGDTTGTIDLMLWDGIQGIWDTIATDINVADLSYDWIVDAESGDMYRLKAIATESSTTYTMSVGYFTIEEEPIQLPNKVVDEKVTIPIAKIIKVFPNPATNKLNIEVEEEPIINVFIWNAVGDLFMSYKNINTQTFILSTEDIPYGQYYIECEMKSGLRLTNKFVIIR